MKCCIYQWCYVATTWDLKERPRRRNSVNKDWTAKMPFPSVDMIRCEQHWRDGERVSKIRRYQTFYGKFSIDFFSPSIATVKPGQQLKDIDARDHSPWPFMSACLSVCHILKERSFTLSSKHLFILYLIVDYMVGIHSTAVQKKHPPVCYTNIFFSIFFFNLLNIFLLWIE